MRTSMTALFVAQKRAVSASSNSDPKARDTADAMPPSGPIKGLLWLLLDTPWPWPCERDDTPLAALLELDEKLWRAERGALPVPVPVPEVSGPPILPLLDGVEEGADGGMAPLPLPLPGPLLADAAVAMTSCCVRLSSSSSSSSMGTT